MQMIHHKSADKVAECHHKFCCSACPDHRMDDFIIICLLIGYIRSSGQKFLDHIGKIFRKRLAHLGTGVLRRRSFADPDQAVQCDLVPVLHVLLGLYHLLHLLFRVIDQCGDRFLFCLTDGIPELVLDLSLDRPGTVL